MTFHRRPDQREADNAPGVCGIGPGVRAAVDRSGARHNRRLQLEHAVGAERLGVFRVHFDPGAARHPGEGIDGVVVVTRDEVERQAVSAECGYSGVSDGAGGACAVGRDSGGRVLDDIGEGGAFVDGGELIEAPIQVFRGRVAAAHRRSGGGERAADEQELERFFRSAHRPGTVRKRAGNLRPGVVRPRQVLDVGGTGEGKSGVRRAVLEDLGDDDAPRRQRCVAGRCPSTACVIIAGACLDKGGFGGSATDSQGE